MSQTIGARLNRLIKGTLPLSRLDVIDIHTRTDRASRRFLAELDLNPEGATRIVEDVLAEAFNNNVLPTVVRDWYVIRPENEDLSVTRIKLIPPGNLLNPNGLISKAIFYRPGQESKVTADALLLSPVA